MESSCAMGWDSVAQHRVDNTVRERRAKGGTYVFLRHNDEWRDATGRSGMMEE
jgi:hypothetical protein